MSDEEQDDFSMTSEEEFYFEQIWATHCHLWSQRDSSFPPMTTNGNPTTPGNPATGYRSAPNQPNTPQNNNTFHSQGGSTAPLTNGTPRSNIPTQSAPASNVTRDEFISYVNRFRVDELKKLLGLLNLARHGRKADLYDRVIEYIDVNQGNLNNAHQLAQTSKRVEYRYQPYPGGVITPSNAPGGYRPGGYSAPYNAAVQSVSGMIKPQLAKSNNLPKPITSIDFEPSPFYTTVKKILGPLTYDVKASSVQFTVTFDDEAKDLISKAHQVRLYTTTQGQANPARIIYPHGFTCMINGNTVPEKEYFVKDKKGVLGQPIDLTKYINPNSSSRINCRFYGQGGVRVTFLLVLSKNVTDEEALAKINSRSEAQVLEQRLKLQKEDEDIVATSDVVSLRDPYMLCRISNPIKSSQCTHIQCFDAACYFTMNRTRPTWECPVCNKKITYASLFVDGYFKNILEKCSDDVESVEIFPDGKWSAVNSSVAATPKNEVKAEAPIVSENVDSDSDEVPLASFQTNTHSFVTDSSRPQPETIIIISDDEGEPSNPPPRTSFPSNPRSTDADDLLIWLS